MSPSFWFQMNNLLRFIKYLRSKKYHKSVKIQKKHTYNMEQVLQPWRTKAKFLFMVKYKLLRLYLQ
jgi:hypothetical protein